MNRRRIGVTVIGAGVVLALCLGALSREVQAARATTFDQLPSGEQKIARALFDAQTATPGGPKPLTLDQIAARNREGWGKVFSGMKTQGLLTQKNLGQVVSDSERRSPGASGRGGDDKGVAGRAAEHGERDASSAIARGSSAGSSSSAGAMGHGGGPSHGGGRGR